MKGQADCTDESGFHLENIKECETYRGSCSIQGNDKK